MRLLFLVLLLRTLPIQAEEVYFLQPDWHFAFKTYGSALVLSGPESSTDYFSKFEVKKQRPNGQFQHLGMIEKPASLHDPTLSYAMEVSSLGHAKAVSRLFSLGTLLSCKREFDVYDFQDEPIGYIGGHLFTSQAAKFALYSADGVRRATATLDKEWKTLTVVDAQDEELILATAEKVFIISVGKKIQYYWKVTLTDEDELLDPRLLWPLITFVADYYWQS